MAPAAGARKASLKCPFCLMVLEPGRKKSKDHIFGQAFGSTATVYACSQCNNRLGHEVEGKLQKPNSLLNLLKAGLPHATLQPVRGNLPDQTPVDFDIRTHEVRLKQPVEDQGDRYIFRGSPRQVRELLRRTSLAPAAIDRSLRNAGQLGIGGQEVQFTLNLDQTLWSRMVAKMALATGYRAAPQFFGSRRAARLRDVCWGRSTPPSVADSTLFERLQQILMGYADAIPGVHPLRPFHDYGHGQMLFYSPAQGHLACVPRIAGSPLPGITVDVQESPWEFGLLVTDTGRGQVEIRDLGQELIPREDKRQRTTCLPAR